MTVTMEGNEINSLSHSSETVHTKSRGSSGRISRIMSILKFWKLFKKHPRKQKVEEKVGCVLEQERMRLSQEIEQNALGLESASKPEREQRYEHVRGIDVNKRTVTIQEIIFGHYISSC